MKLGNRALEFISPPGGFMQSNMYINRIMAGHLMDLAGDSKRILELYSGAGNFTLPLSLNARQVSAIERNKGLNDMGRLNAKKNKVTNIRFLRMESKKAVHSVCDEKIHYDTIVLDPPRTGAAEISGSLPKTDASRIIYISCNPSTLSRDLATLRKGGFTIKNTRFFDMFPQTYHIESITCLER
jgi:23S rRNA (uracil1939-C5)-methyltransferase